VIQLFKCPDTQALFEGRCAKRFVNVRALDERKLLLLDATASLDALRSPPGNRLEAMCGDRVGQHSIYIKDHWRVCFVWTPDGPEAAEIVGYH
jgi:proteic killer suppression protein